jgi:molybdopterin converting factor small subunit
MTTGSKPSPGHFRILYFASASSFINKSSEELKAPLELKDLFDRLEGTYPGFKQAVLSSCAVTVNLDYMNMEDPDDFEDGNSRLQIAEGDEVAIIPPVSSG